MARLAAYASWKWLTLCSMAQPLTPLLSSAVWQGLSFDWLWVYRGYVPKVREWSPEITVPAGWFWVEKGLVKIQADGHEICVKAGESFFTAPGTRRQWFKIGTRLLSVGFRCQWLDGSPLYKTDLNLVMTQSKMAALHEATQSLFTSVHGSQSEVTYQNGIEAMPRSFSEWCLVEAAFRQWFSVYVDSLEASGIQPQVRMKVQDRKLEAWLSALNVWPLDQPLKLEHLVRDSKVSVRHLHDRLRRHLGMTAQAWLERRRLEVARQRLSTEDTAFKEIAFDLGFRYPPHFTAWFKRHTTMTPSAFRSGNWVDAA
jgi:AraC-like DNA-binding protein